MKPEITLYDALEISPQASAGVVKAAYRCLAQANHPDKNAGSVAASERLTHINHAYSVLSDPEKRRRYDLTQKTGPVEQERRGRAKSPAAQHRPIATARPSSRAFVFRPLPD
jgi:DnaJ-class molecular chaperone